MKKKLILILAFAMILTQPAFAATPDVNTLDEATRNALNDNNLEYNEIDELIHYFNPTVQAMWKSADDALSDVRDAKDELNDAIEDLEDAYDDAKDAGNTAVANYLKISIKGLKATRSTITKALNQLDKDTGSINKKLTRVEGQLAGPARQLMLAYKQVEINNALLGRLDSLYTEQYNATLAAVSAGTSTQNDVTQALADMQSAKANLSSLAANGAYIYDTLKIMCGWSATGTPVIGEIPAADVSKIATYNPEADLVYAAGNTDAVTDERSNNTTYGRNSEAEQTAYVKTELDTLYASVLSAKQSYDAAAVGYQAAQMSWNAAQVQYKSGMISKLQYLGLEISYVQKEAAYKLANIALMQAMESYETAVNYGV